MQQHTPGPWQWWTSNSLRRLTSHAGGRSQQDGGVLHAYRCRDGVADVCVNEADMALIAAAPDLKEALRDLMARVALDSPEECAEVAALLGIEDQDSLWEAAAKAQAALDKADGLDR